MLKNITEFFKKILEKFPKLKLAQKVALISIALFFVGFIIYSFNISVQPSKVYLFKKPISITDYAKITAEIDKMGVSYETLDEKYILVEDEKTGIKIRTTLAQNNVLPEGIKGWELFDMESWTTTEFDRSIKLRRAIEGEMKKHIESLNWIESTEISIAIPKKVLYTERDKDVSAALTLVPKEGYYDWIKNKKLIKGIENIILRGIDGITRENITITDQNGNDLNDFSSDDYENSIKQAIAENQIKDREIRKIKKKIEESLLGVYSPDRYKVAVDLEINFDRKTLDQKEVLPVVIKERTPGLPYDDSVIKDSVKVSSKKINEKFEGVGFIPEGPPGQEPNLPPGYKESLDGRNRYNKDEQVDNYLNGEKSIKQVNDAMEVERKSISVSVDGIWKKKYNEKGELLIKNSRVEREYIPISEEDLKKLRDIVKGAINFNNKRSDTVVVKNIAFDRELQFLEEDKKIIKAQKVNKIIAYSFIAFFILLVTLILYRIIAKELKERKIRKKHAEKLLREMQLDKAIRDLESSKLGVGQVSDDEKEFLKLQDEINLIVKEEPDQVAKVLASWLNE